MKANNKAIEVNKTNKAIISDKECVKLFDQFIDYGTLILDQSVDVDFEYHFRENFETDFANKSLPSKDKMVKLLMSSSDLKKHVKRVAEEIIDSVITVFECAEEDYIIEEEERKEKELERLEEEKQAELDRLEEEKEEAEYEREQEKSKKAKLAAKSKLAGLTTEQRQALQEAYGIAV